MTSAKTVIDFYKCLANRGGGVDKDGAYGFQCADVPTYAAKHWFGVDLWGNAIDLLDSAKKAGWEVIYRSSGQMPRPGAFFVMDYVAGGVNYGHTGLIISEPSGGVVQTIEQNLAGNLSVGSPAQYTRRSVASLRGWFYPPYTGGSQATASSSNVARQYAETGVMTVTIDSINIRRAPNTRGDIVGQYKKGESFKYDQVIIDVNGFVWVSYVGASGKRNYVATGETRNGKRHGKTWGTFR